MIGESQSLDPMAPTADPEARLNAGPKLAAGLPEIRPDGLACEIEIRKSFGLAMFFVSHDLDVVELMCDRIVVLYPGRIMEIGPAEAVCSDPRHSSTQALPAASSRAQPMADEGPGRAFACINTPAAGRRAA